MTRSDPSRGVTVRYWASARAASGCDQEVFAPGSVTHVLQAAANEHPDLIPILRVASVLLDGVNVPRDTQAPSGSTLEVLPPFAGG